MKVKGETKTTVQYAITSLSPQAASAEKLLRLWRDRWAIENRLFWFKDVVLGEDHSRIRSGQAPRAMSVVRNAIVNYLRTCNVKHLAAELRRNALNNKHLFTKLGILNL